MMYEGVLLFGVIFLADYLFDTLTQSRNALMLRHTRQAMLFIAIGIYFIISWRRHGQTLPMKTWNIKVVAASGNAASLGRLTLRYLLAWPLPLLGMLAVHGMSKYTGFASTNILFIFAPFTIFIWTWLDPDKQFLHDRLAGTRLINSTRSSKYATKP